jgi:hypothetical protein
VIFSAGGDGRRRSPELPAAIRTCRLRQPARGWSDIRQCPILRLSCRQRLPTVRARAPFILGAGAFVRLADFRWPVHDYSQGNHGHPHILPVVGAAAPLLGTTGASARSSALGWSWFGSRCCATLWLAIGTRLHLADGQSGSGYIMNNLTCDW